MESKVDNLRQLMVLQQRNPGHFQKENIGPPGGHQRGRQGGTAASDSSRDDAPTQSPAGQGNSFQSSTWTAPAPPAAAYPTLAHYYTHAPQGFPPPAHVYPPFSYAAFPQWLPMAQYPLNPTPTGPPRPSSVDSALPTRAKRTRSQSPLRPRHRQSRRGEDHSSRTEDHKGRRMDHEERKRMLERRDRITRENLERRRAVQDTEAQLNEIKQLFAEIADSQLPQLTAAVSRIEALVREVLDNQQAILEAIARLSEL